jgi:hypothetical protein
MVSAIAPFLLLAPIDFKNGIFQPQGSFLIDRFHLARINIQIKTANLNSVRYFISFLASENALISRDFKTRILLSSVSRLPPDLSASSP